MQLSPLQEFVFYRTYSRWQEDLGRRETWDEAVDRYFTFFKEKFGDKVPAKVFKKARENVVTMGTMPSMRAFWTAGDALEKCNVAGYNCCYLAFKDLRSPVELFYILMCGTGVGFSVEKEYISRMPSVVPQNGSGRGVHVVGDSKEGWSDALYAGLEAWFDGSDLEFDYSKVRPRGARLKTMGGRASGPEPLKELLGFVKEIVLAAQGRKLTSLEWLDIGNKIAEVVVVGGVRRSSEITFSDLDDTAIRDAKDFSKGPFPLHRYMSNNSAVYWGRPDAVTFMREWTALAASGAGERGIFNANNSTAYAPRRTPSRELRCNPCVTGKTEILTKNGYRRIDDLVDQTVDVWNGFEWSSVVPKVTGFNQQILRVELSSGQSLECTPAHRWVVVRNGETARITTEQLEIGDRLLKVSYPVIFEGTSSPNAYAQGFWSAEGMDEYDYMYVYGPKHVCLDRLSSSVTISAEKDNQNRFRVKPTFDRRPKAFIPFDWNLESRLNWFAGLLDGDGCVLKEGGVQISSVNRQFLLDVQKMLTTCGVSSKVVKGRDAAIRVLPDGQGSSKQYSCQADWRLCLGASQVQTLIQYGLTCSRLNILGFVPNRDASRFIQVTAVEEVGVEPIVYCFTEEKRHLGCFEGVVTGQCGEIMLRDSQFCNLSEVVVRANDTMATLTSKVRSAVWLGAMQACLTDFPYLRPDFKKNCEEERLLGVSLTGQMDHKRILTAERLYDLKMIAIEEGEKACAALNINMSVAITTGKPSGTVSQLVDAASGAHPRYAPYYVRRVRISATDPLCKMLRAQKVSMVPETGQGPEKVTKARQKLLEQGFDQEQVVILQPDWTPEMADTWVVSFPIAAPENAITRNDMSALEQLEWYKTVRTNWCEHNQSITVYVRDEEWLKVGQWVYENFDCISGISFLPYDGGNYELAPYEEINQELYELAKSVFPKIDYSQLAQFEREDNTTGAQALACTAAGCELP